MLQDGKTDAQQAWYSIAQEERQIQLHGENKVRIDGEGGAEDEAGHRAVGNLRNKGACLPREAILEEAREHFMHALCEGLRAHTRTGTAKKKIGIGYRVLRTQRPAGMDQRTHAQQTSHETRVGPS